MDKKVVGFIIRRERMRRDWSQDGLCRGICAASYLSKIEQGRVEASEDILRLLYERLELPWYGGESAMSGLSERLDELYELAYSGEFEVLREKISALAPENAALLQSPAAPDIAVLDAAANWRGGTDAGVDAGMEQHLSPRGLALLRLMQDRDAEAAAICPSALCSYWAGVAQYESGRSYTAAVENLQRAYSLAAGEGRARLMMLSRAYIGTCYCNQLDVENMEAHYTVAERLATALHDAGMLASIRYNRAATALETGDYESAYRYFSALEEPTAMALHKLAICCEKLGRRDEAFSALDYQTRLEVTEDVYRIIRREKVTALMVTHDIPESISMGDRVLILSPRPAVIREQLIIDLPGLGGARTPLSCRSQPGFGAYFDHIWKELGINEAQGRPSGDVAGTARLSAADTAT